MFLVYLGFSRDLWINILLSRSSTESERRLSSESSKSVGESSKTEKTLIAVHESKKAADVEVEEILKPAQRPTEETSPGPEDHVKSKPENTEEKVKKPAEDVFNFEKFHVKTMKISVQ